MSHDKQHNAVEQAEWTIVNADAPLTEEAIDALAELLIALDDADCVEQGDSDHA